MVIPRPVPLPPALGLPLPPTPPRALGRPRQRTRASLPPPRPPVLRTLSPRSLGVWELRRPGVWTVWPLSLTPRLPNSQTPRLFWTLSLRRPLSSPREGTVRLPPG